MGSVRISMIPIISPQDRHGIFAKGKAILAVRLKDSMRDHGAARDGLLYASE